MPPTNPIIQTAESEAEILRCYPVMAQLRPHLSEAAFLEQVLRQMEEGYQLAFLSTDGVVQSVAGFRLLEMLSRGRFVYVDDLVTDETTRSAGYGQQLLDWLLAYAQANNCLQLDLDSGVARFGAHRFYFRAGLHISAYHFSVAIAE